MPKGSVEVSGPGENRKYSVKHYNGDEGATLNIARSAAITLAARCMIDGNFTVRDENDEVYCTVQRVGKTIKVVMQ